MIDTIKLNYSFVEDEYEQTFNHLKENYLLNSDVKALTTLYNGKMIEGNTSIVFNTEHFNLYLNKDYITVKTSLWKLYLGNNWENFDSEQILKSIDMLQKLVPTVRWLHANVTTVHIGPSLKVNNNPDFYLNIISGREKMVWTNFDGKGNSKSIGSKKNYVILYNKTKESKQTNGQNILRIEYRIESPYWFKKYFGSTRPKLSDLINNLDMIYILWYEQYNKLEKNYSYSAGYVNSINDLFHFAISEYGYDKCKAIVLNSHKLGKMTTPQKDYAMKRIRDLKLKKNNLEVVNNYATDLDNIVEQFILDAVPNYKHIVC